MKSRDIHKYSWDVYNMKEGYTRETITGSLFPRTLMSPVQQ
jgi:hypothetical protein